MLKFLSKFYAKIDFKISSKEIRFGFEFGTKKSNGVRKKLFGSSIGTKFPKFVTDIIDSNPILSYALEEETHLEFDSDFNIKLRRKRKRVFEF